MSAKRLLLLIACAALAASCEIPFELDKVSDPAFYVQYIADAGKRNGMIVSYAEPAFGTLSKEKYPFVAEDVTLLVGGKTVKVAEDTAASSWNGHMLMLDVVPSPGDEVEVRVKGRNVPDVVGRTVIPQPPVISSVTIVRPDDSTNVYRVSIKLDRNVTEGERYGLKAVKRVTAVWMSGKGTPDQPESVKLDTTVSVSYFMPGQIATTADLNSLDLDAFASITYQDGFLDGGMFQGEVMTLLADRQFTGDTYSFYINALDSFSSGAYDLDFGWEEEEGDYPGDYPETPEDPEDPGDEEITDPDEPEFWTVIYEREEYMFELFRLSPEFYNYAKAQYLCNFNMLSNFGVSPPNFTYSNISGGLGLVGGIAGVTTDWIPAPRPE